MAYYVQYFPAATPTSGTPCLEYGDMVMRTFVRHINLFMVGIAGVILSFWLLLI